MSALHNQIDFKALIHENVKKMTRSEYKYDYYEECVKYALSEYILFLRTGSCTWYDFQSELVENMTIDEMVDLLSDELYLRTNFYKNNPPKNGRMVWDVITTKSPESENYKFILKSEKKYKNKIELYKKYIEYDESMIQGINNIKKYWKMKLQKQM